MPVTLHGTLNPVKTARFKVVSSCPSVLILSPVEFDLTFATCASAGETIATITVANFGSPVTCNFSIEPLDGDDRIELTDCDGFAMRGCDTFGRTEPCDGMSGILGPYRPSPADGAIDVPVDTKLEYVGFANYVEMADFNFTGDNGPPWPEAVCSHWGPAPPCTYPIDPGVLQPSTTYYWRAFLYCVGCEHGEHGRSEIFSFTTGGTVAIESTTWGRVKSMYRD